MRDLPYRFVAPGSGDDSVFSNGKMQMSIEVLLNIFDAGELPDLTDANLPPLFIAAHLRSLVRRRRHYKGVTVVRRKWLRSQCK